MNPRINCDTQKRSTGSSDRPQYKFLAAADRNPQRSLCFRERHVILPALRLHDLSHRRRGQFVAGSVPLRKSPRFKEPGMECNVEMDWETQTWGRRFANQRRGLEISLGNLDEATLVVERSILYTVDGGKSWKAPHTTPSSKAADGRTQWANGAEVVTTTWNYYIDPFDHQRHYICYTDNRLARSWTAEKIGCLSFGARLCRQNGETPLRFGIRS